ncbi:AAA domain, partial [Rhizoctonia solani]
MVTTAAVDPATDEKDWRVVPCNSCILADFVSVRLLNKSVRAAFQDLVMKLSFVALFLLVEVSLGFNIDASAIRAAEAAEIGEETPHFGNFTIHGQIQPTSLTFPDGLHLLLYSPSAQNVSIEKKDQPSAPSGFVTPLDSAAVSLGSGSWMAMYNYSWSINFESQSADDVIATIEVPYSRETLQELGIRYENTFVAKFDSIRGGWVIDTSKASIESNRNLTRVVGLSSPGGEYMLLGRKSGESHNAFLRPGSSSESSDFQVEAPPANSLGQTDPSKAPVQIGTWTDGFQLEVRSCKRMRVNMNLFNASESKVQSGFKAISSYGYMVNTSEPDSKVAVVARIPLRQSQIDAQLLNNSQLQVAQLDPASGEFRIDDGSLANTTSISPRILPRSIEIATSSLDAKWILVVPEVLAAKLAGSSPELAPSAPSPSPTSTIMDCGEPLTTATSTDSTPGLNSPIATATGSMSSAVPIATPLNDGAEKVMKLERVPKAPSRSRMRRIRYAKSELLYEIVVDYYESVGSCLHFQPPEESARAPDSWVARSHVEINLIDKNQPQIVEVIAVDRAIIKDRDIAFILDSLPAQSEARIDEKPYKPYIGIDLFYGKDGNVKGLVFVTLSRALVVRIPDNAAKTSAARYEKKLVEKPEDKPKPMARTKGQKSTRIAPELTPYERLRQLLDANFAAFGMAQITLTLWDTLREKVEGVNLSSVGSQPIPPPSRAVPDPNSTLGEESGKGDADGNGNESRRKEPRGRGGRGGRGNYRGRGNKNDKERGGGRGGRNNKNEPEDDSSSSVKPKMIPVKLPEDEEKCWDKELLSPGHLVNKFYPHVSRMDINAVFFGQDRESDMFERVAEAISRAWIAYRIANHEEINPKVLEAPVVKPSRLTDEELTFFSKSMVAAWRVMGEEEADRAVEREDIKAGRTNEFVNKTHKKRIRESKHQEIRVRMKDGQEKVFYGKKAFDNAKAVKLKENELTSEEEDKPKKGNRSENSGVTKGRKNGRRQHKFKDLVGGPNEFTSEARAPDENETATKEEPLFDMENLESIQIYGREQATMSENARDMFVLRLLEGRGSLRDPEYKDCEFIRRVWFPNRAQQETGKKREANNAPAVVKKERYDWVEDSWGDDTDEEEAALALKNKVPESELIDYDTEDDELGDDLPLHEVVNVVPELKGRINPSQLKVIGRVTAPNPGGRTRATLVHGPPGTGKTSTITAAAIRLVKSGEYVWIVAQSNVGISNVADKLRKIKFDDFVLIVADEYYQWWEGQYENLKPYVVRTKQLKSSEKRFRGKRLVLCTLASLSNPGVENQVMYQHVPLRNLIIDEASQIDMTSEFMHLFFKHRYALRNVCWFGDPMQLPPYGWSEAAKINDIFKVEHLQANSKLMDTSYRLPIPIAKFISQEVYKNRLLEDTKHEVKTPTEAMLFVDTPKGEELKEERGTSFMNHEEAKLVVQIVELYYNKVDKKTGKPYDFQIITPYEAQRKMVHDMLKQAGIDKEVYNVDSFQGNEADYIITTLTKTTFSSFLSSINRLNVLLTRCKKGLVVVSQKEFITRTGGLLRGLWWKYESDDIWKDADDVSKGYVNLPGSPAPVKRSVEGEDEVRRFVFEMFLPADGDFKEPETESDSE